MGEVAALVEAHREDRVARLQERLVDRDVRVGPAVGLHVRVIGTEERDEATTRQVLDFVDDLIAAVVAAAGVALGVLVGEDRTGRGEHGRRGEVLTGDQLDRRRLTLPLLGEQRRHLVVVRDPRVKG